MSYERMSIQEFGSSLLRSGDLDPVYVALYDNRSRWTVPQMGRWLLAYWCFYNCGLASWMSERDEDYWRMMALAARNEEPAPIGGRWPRGRERRHFRGKAATDAIEYLERNWTVMGLFEALLSAAPDYQKVSKRVQTLRGFGPWISFKVCDMIDRVIGVDIDFTEAAVFMFKDPIEGALRYWRVSEGLAPDAQPEDRGRVIHGVVEELTETFQGFTAPPRHERPVGLQEVETILCKWKSHLNGHYPLGIDLREITEGVRPWAKINCQTAYQFLEKMPKEI